MALADKVDTVAGLFAAGEKPTGSRDPLGIRRQAQGLLRILVDLPELTALDVRVAAGQLLGPARGLHARGGGDPADFLLERLRHLLEERGFDRRNVRAVTHQPLDEVRPLDARRKLEALPEFSDTAEFRTLAALFKRVRNIAKELADGGAPDEPFEDALREPAERALLADLTARRSVIDAAVETGAGFREAFAAAAALGPAVDRFFLEVFVMADDPAVRRARLLLLQRVERVILRLADVSEIVHT